MPKCLFNDVYPLLNLLIGFTDSRFMLISIVLGLILKVISLSNVVSLGYLFMKPVCMSVCMSDLATKTQ